MESNQSEPSTQTEPKHNILFQVISLPGYLAVTSLVVLLFGAAWVGYTFAPAKTTEPASENKTMEQPTSGEKNFDNVAAGVTNLFEEVSQLEVGESISHYPSRGDVTKSQLEIDFAALNRVLGVEPDTTVYGMDIYKIDKRHVVIGVNANPAGGHDFTFLLNNTLEKLVKKLTIPGHVFWANTFWFTVTDQDESKIAYQAVATFDGFVYIYDYLNDSKELLYTEERAGHVLYEICEFYCSGVFTRDKVSGDFIVGVYEEVPRTSWANFKEAIQVNVPRQFKDATLLSER